MDSSSALGIPRGKTLLISSCGRSACLSSGNGASNGQIVGISNGEGRGAACRAVKPKEDNETAKCSGEFPGGPPRGHRQVCSASLQGDSEQDQESRRHREPLRSSMCRREGTHGASVVSSQRSDRRAGCQRMPVPVQGRTEDGGRV